MKTTIHNKLKDIEQVYEVKILYACESGSRAWGFPSPDSDYDVRFIYAKPLNNYLSIRNEKDFMDFPLNDELDINGWDLRKTLELIAKSNSVPFEWLQSPIVYHEEENFAKDLLALCQSYFCPRTCIHHYLGIAKGARGSENDGEIGIKKLFYILRPLLSALWCVEKQSISPMEIFLLLSLMPKELETEVLKLIELKASAKERFEIQIDDSLKEWINLTFAKCMENAIEIDKKYTDIELLNAYFRKTITQ